MKQFRRDHLPAAPSILVPLTVLLAVHGLLLAGWRRARHAPRAEAEAA